MSAPQPRSCPPAARLARLLDDPADVALGDHVSGCTTCSRYLRDAAELRLQARIGSSREPDPAWIAATVRGAVSRAAPARAEGRLLPLVIASCGGAAAALVLAGLPAAPPPPSPPVATVAVPGPRAETVYLPEGRVRFDLDPLRAGERFVVTTDDAEVEVKGTRFWVEVRAGRLQHVEVERGIVEVRRKGEVTVTLPAGRAWSAPTPASRARARMAARREPVPPDALVPSLPAPAPFAEAGVEDAPPPPSWRDALTAGWDALEAGRSEEAARSFATVPAGSPLREEAAYWRAIAELQAHGGREIEALHGFLEEFPRSPRAGEIALLLGERLAAAGRSEEARPLFEAAAGDPRGEVSRRARAGLKSLPEAN